MRCTLHLVRVFHVAAIGASIFLGMPEIHVRAKNNHELSMILARARRTKRC